jgi:hypothetical protein
MPRRVPTILLAAAIYLVLTLILTWPLVVHLGSVVPNDLGDPLLNTWLLAWNARALPLTTHWWNAPQFFPVQGAMAFSEHLLGLSAIATPLIVLTGNALVGYNVAFLLSFPLCALSAHWLGYTIARRHDVGFVAGLAFAFAPYRMAQFAHIQVMSPYWMPIALVGLHRYMEDRRARWLALFAAGWTMQALTCGYYLFYLSVFVALWIVWFIVSRGAWVDLGRVTVAWAAGAVALVPIVYGYWTIQRAQGLRRDLLEIKVFSADIASLLKAPDNVWLWRWLSVYDRAEGALFPGATLVVLLAAAVLIGVPSASGGRRPLLAARFALGGAAIAIGLALSPALVGPWKLQLGTARLFTVSSAAKPLMLGMVLIAIAAFVHPGFRLLWRRRSAFVFYVLAAIVLWLFSLGPDPTLMNVPVRSGTAPYAWLLHLPGVDGVRVPARFWMLSILCLGVAAGLAVRHLVSRWPSLGRVLPAAACVGLLADGWPTPVTYPAPPPSRPSHASADLRLDLPIDAWRDLAVLYQSIEHRTPLVNGYSGYFPRHYYVLQYLCTERNPRILERLASWGSLEVVVDHHEDPSGAWRAFVAGYHRARVVYSDAEYTSYLIDRTVASSAVQRPQGTSLPIASLTAYQRAAPVAAMRDNDLVTRWHAGRAMEPGDTVTADLGEPREVTGAEMLLGEYVVGFPRQLRIETSLDAEHWDVVWTGSGAIPAFEAAIEDPRTVALPFVFPSRSARYVRFTQTATELVHYWSIAELRIIGR